VRAMVWFIYIGTAMTLAGLAGIFLFIRGALRLRKGGLDEATMRAELQKLVPLNLGSFLLSALGLMCVVLGVILA
jgi:hypothetical protein